MLGPSSGKNRESKVIRTPVFLMTRGVPVFLEKLNATATSSADWTSIYQVRVVNEGAKKSNETHIMGSNASHLACAWCGKGRCVGRVQVIQCTLRARGLARFPLRIEISIGGAAAVSCEESCHYNFMTLNNEGIY